MTFFRPFAGLLALSLAACTGSMPTADLPRYDAAVSAPADSPVARHGQLAIEGNKIVDERGDPVTLRGMSLFWSQWEPEFYSAETVRWLARDWKVSGVRAAIAAEGNDSARQHFDRELAKAGRVIEAAAEEGIYVIVDWHAHRNYPDDAERFLVAIAERYGHLPNLIYEPFNEPLRDDVDWARDVKPYHQRIVAAIRAVDPDNLIILGTPSWSQYVDIAARDPVAGENLGYTLHYYAATHKQDLRDRADAALAEGQALMITEFGLVQADGDGAIDVASSMAWWDWAEANDVSWFNWSIADKDEGSAALKPGTGPSGWTEADLTASGKMLRDRLRAAAAAEGR